MSAPCVHHVGIGVLDEKPMLKLFQEKLGFQLLSTRRTNIDEKWVLCKNNVKFVLTTLVETKAFGRGISSASSLSPSSSLQSSTTTSSKTTNALNATERCRSSLGDGNNYEVDDLQVVKENNCHGEGVVGDCFSNSSLFGSNESSKRVDDEDNIQTASSPHPLWPDFSTSWNQPRMVNEGCSNLYSDCYPEVCANNNSVYEVCLEVRNVGELLQRAIRTGAEVLKPLTVVSSADGEVTYATIRSCVGNVQHTILNTDKYYGKFLPGFEDREDVSDVRENLHHDPLSPLDIDHITLCVPPQHTIETIAWYQNCFGMHRLIVNRNEDAEEGLMLNDIQMRMAAMEYWHCSESGLSLGADMNSVKFVVAESLSDAPNQVSTFLKRHGGPGVQHIGLSTHRLVDGLKQLKTVGVEFLQPPKEYYNEIGKLKEIEDCGESVALLEECGILLDSEADCSVEESQPELDDPQSRYLMQTFTKPIFGDDTFFLEFLQRHGALGFGAGNITALWRAVKQYMEKYAN